MVDFTERMLRYWFVRTFVDRCDRFKVERGLRKYFRYKDRDEEGAEGKVWREFIGDDGGWERVLSEDFRVLVGMIKEYEVSEYKVRHIIEDAE